MGDASPVLVFNLCVPPGALVFHLMGRHGDEIEMCPLDRGINRWVARTGCGRISYIAACWPGAHDGEYVARPHDHCAQERATWLRRDQAEVLGRLCKACEAAA